MDLFLLILFVFCLLLAISTNAGKVIFRPLGKILGFIWKGCVGVLGVLVTIILVILAVGVIVIALF